MALNSSRSSSNPTVPNEALTVKGIGQLGLNQRIIKMRKTSLTATKTAWVHGRINAAENVKANEILRAQFSCPSPILLNDGHDTESIIRASQIVRSQLMNASSYLVSNEVVVDTEEKKKVREMLQAQLLSVSTSVASKNEVVVDNTSKPTSLDMPREQLAITPFIGHRLTIKPQLKTQCFLNDFDYSFLNSGDNNDNYNHTKGKILCPTPLSVCFSNETSDNNTLQNVSNMGEPINLIENDYGNEDDNKYDGRMHSYPYKKNGPYTCPKCGHLFDTPQRFAAHVNSSHYKYETKCEKRKRLMAKVKGRNLRLQVMNDGLITVVPASTPLTAAENNNNNVRDRNVGPVMVKVEVNGEHGVEVALALAPPPGMKLLTGAGAGIGAAGSGGEGVKIKIEPVDEYTSAITS